MIDDVVEIRPNRSLNIIHLKNPNQKTLFLLHGAGGRAEQWQNQIDYFKNDYNIVAPDFLGQGNSQKPLDSLSYSFQELSLDIQALFDKYHSVENYIVGHSYGGAFASYLTLQNPKQIKKLILLAPTPLQEKLTITKFFRLPIAILELLRPLLTHSFTKLAFDKQTDPQIIAHEVTMGRKNPMYVIKPLSLGMSQMPTVDIKKIKQPTLVITGHTDNLLPRQLIYNFYQQLPNVEFKEINNASHMLILEQPQQVNQLMKNFLDK